MWHAAISFQPCLCLCPSPCHRYYCSSCLQHFDYPGPAVDRFEFVPVPVLFLLHSRSFPFLFRCCAVEALPVGHKKITEPINAVRRFTDRMSSSLSLAHCPFSSWFLVLCYSSIYACLPVPFFSPCCLYPGSWLLAPGFPDLIKLTAAAAPAKWFPRCALSTQLFVWSSTGNYPQRTLVSFESKKYATNCWKIWSRWLWSIFYGITFLMFTIFMAVFIGNTVL